MFCEAHRVHWCPGEWIKRLDHTYWSGAKQVRLMLTVGVEEEGDAGVASSHRAICLEQCHGEEITHVQQDRSSRSYGI